MHPALAQPIGGPQQRAIKRGIEWAVEPAVRRALEHTGADCLSQRELTHGGARPEVR
jgi:hypothetical protein